MIDEYDENFASNKLTLMFESIGEDKVRFKCSLTTEPRNFGMISTNNEKTTTTTETTTTTTSTTTDFIPSSSETYNYSDSLDNSSCIEVTCAQLAEALNSNIEDIKLPGFKTFSNHCNADWKLQALKFMSRNRKGIVGPNRKLFMCLQCGKFLATKQSSQYHSYIHSGEKKFPCYVCDKRYFSKRGLAWHIKKFHGKNTVDRSYKIDISHKFSCTLCKRGFKYKDSLIRHSKSYHSTSLNYICTICGKGFHYKTHFNSHIETEMRQKDRLMTSQKVLGYITSQANNNVSKTSMDVDYGHYVMNAMIV